MNKEKELERLTALENEAKELRKIMDAPEKLSAEQWLLNFLSHPFEVKLTQDYITYYRDGQWIFQQDLKIGYLWCYYYAVWQVFEKEYSMNRKAIQALQKNIVGKALNCEVFTPCIALHNAENPVGKALNCEVFTPVRLGEITKQEVGKALNCEVFTPENKN